MKHGAGGPSTHSVRFMGSPAWKPTTSRKHGDPLWTQSSTGGTTSTPGGSSTPSHIQLHSSVPRGFFSTPQMVSSPTSGLQHLGNTVRERDLEERIDRLGIESAVLQVRGELEKGRFMREWASSVLSQVRGQMKKWSSVFEGPRDIVDFTDDEQRGVIAMRNHLDQQIGMIDNACQSLFGVLMETKHAMSRVLGVEPDVDVVGMPEGMEAEEEKEEGEEEMEEVRSPRKKKTDVKKKKKNLKKKK
eukprot:TRINITY_DN234_c0_g2_i2.p1 TRINITY_DN234_c0_g2~~TRINITY_DN234_c0_g2_i2.p1  ORF type:complete len:275 (-),score=92.33 TRINITY_DN234_c0_g2_i2:235-969(-)